MGEKSVLLLVILFIHAKISLAGCSTNDGTAKLNQDAAQYIFQKIYDDLTVAVSNMDFVSSSHKYVNSLRRPLRGEDINLDINTEITANPIQNLMFDIFAATGKDKSIYMGYHDKHFLSYRTVPEKVFSIYDNTSAQTVSYSFNLDDGQANTKDGVLNRKDYDCTGRPWYIQGSASDNCPSDENKKLDCRMTWTDPYVDYQVNQLVISANMGVPMYSGPATLPEIAGGFLEGGRAVDDSLLGVIASDYFLDDVDKILAHAMNKVSSESSDVAYLMTSDLVLLAVSDGSINTECVTSSCSEQNIILATDSPSQRIKTSARYLRDNNIMSDNTLLMTHLDTQFVLTVKEFRELGLDWLIVTVASHNYDKSCILELQSVKLKEAAHAVDILTSKAAVAGMLVKYALQTTGGVLANPTGGRFEMQAWDDINKNNTMSMENILKISAEIFPEIDAILVGYQDNAFMAWKNTPDGRFAHFSYQYPGTSSRGYFYSNPDTGYVYKDFNEYKRISYVVTSRPWYEAATREQVPLFSDPYLFEDFETIGTTYSAPFFNSDGDLAGVIGIDITLDLITEQLRSFTSPGDVIFGMETTNSGEDRNYNMLASSSRSTMAFEDSDGNIRQTKAYVSEEVKDYFVYSAAAYMKENSVTIDTSFTTGNFTCSVLNYDNHGLNWRFVEVTYLYNGQISYANNGVDIANDNGFSASADVNPALIVLQGFNFTILLFVVAALAILVYRQDILMKMVKRRRVRRKSHKLDMIVNPLLGSNNDAGPGPASSDSETSASETGKGGVSMRRASKMSINSVTSPAGGTVSRRGSAAAAGMFAPSGSPSGAGAGAGDVDESEAEKGRSGL